MLFNCLGASQYLGITLDSQTRIPVNLGCKASQPGFDCKSLSGWGCSNTLQVVLTSACAVFQNRFLPKFNLASKTPVETIGPISGIKLFSGLVVASSFCVQHIPTYMNDSSQLLFGSRTEAGA